MIIDFDEVRGYLFKKSNNFNLVHDLGRYTHTLLFAKEKPALFYFFERLNPAWLTGGLESIKIRREYKIPSSFSFYF